jgi:hypothetical protein
MKEVLDAYGPLPSDSPSAKYGPDTKFDGERSWSAGPEGNIRVITEHLLGGEPILFKMTGLFQSDPVSYVKDEQVKRVFYGIIVLKAPWQLTIIEPKHISPFLHSLRQDSYLTSISSYRPVTGVNGSSEPLFYMGGVWGGCIDCLYLDLDDGSRIVMSLESKNKIYANGQTYMNETIWGVLLNLAKEQGIPPPKE